MFLAARCRRIYVTEVDSIIEKGMGVMAKKNKTTTEQAEQADQVEDAAPVELVSGGIIDEMAAGDAPAEEMAQEQAGDEPKSVAEATDAFLTQTKEEMEEAGAQATNLPLYQEICDELARRAAGSAPHHIRFHDNNTTGVFDCQGTHLRRYDGTHREAVKKMADAGYDWRKAAFVNGTPQLEEAVGTGLPPVVDCGHNPIGRGMGAGAGGGHEVDCGFNPGKKGHVKPAETAIDKESPSSQ